MGWIFDILAMPLSMHRRLHLLRQRTPPVEEPKEYPIDDDRAPGKMLKRSQQEHPDADPDPLS
jgi:hypothetical protein